MNHVAFSVPPEKFDEYVAKLDAKGIVTSGVVHHDDSENQITRRMHDGVFLRSIYFWDPDGSLLELACWTRELTADDVNAAPATRDVAGVKASGSDEMPWRKKLAS